MRSRHETDIDDLWPALTETQPSARWHGKVEVDLRVGGDFTATVFGSGWDGRGRIDVGLPPWKLEVTMWDGEGAETVGAAEVVADGDHAGLVIERQGIPLLLLWAFEAGWREHLEDLGAHLMGQERPDGSARGDSRFDELTPSYREMAVQRRER